MRLAQLQHSLARTAQLRFLGLSRDAITTRVRRGTLTPIHRGVYLIGTAVIADLQRCAAAVLATGPASLLSNRAAAFLWGWLTLGREPIAITLAGAHLRQRPGIRLHFADRCDRRDLRRRDLLPLTSPPLTLLGLAESESEEDLSDAVNEARKRRHVRREELLTLRDRLPRRPGWRALRPFLAHGNDDYSRSPAENRLEGLITAAALPAPRRNVRVHGHELDFYWPDLRLNVEVDGYEWHSARGSLNADRERDAELASRGVWVVRFTGDQVHHQRERTLSRLAAAIAIAEGRRT